MAGSDTDNSTHPFVIDYTTAEGETLHGQFTCKRLSIRDRSKVGARKSQLSGGMFCVRDDEGNPTGMGLDEDTDFLNTAIAHLEIALIQAPLWWDLDKIADTGLVRAVYSKVINFETKFFRSTDRTTVTNRPDQGSENGRAAASQEAQLGAIPKEVVGQEVQAALDA